MSIYVLDTASIEKHHSVIDNSVSMSGGGRLVYYHWLLLTIMGGFLV